MSDAWLVIGIFVFAFLLWVSTGGPTRPISFAGPFITPITDVDDTQEGYGEDINVGSGERRSGIWSVRSIFGRFENSVGEEENVGPVSPQAGSIRIVSRAGGPSGTSPDKEYIAVRAENASIDITGFTVASSRSGVNAIIPQAAVTPGGALTNVVLGDGDEAVITTGSSPLGSSFRENKCIGYLGITSFIPPLANRSCPSPTEELGYGYTGSASSYDECRAIVSNFPRCETQRSAPDEASGECKAFIESRLNYEGCVNTHFNDEDYQGDTWRVYLNRGNELWRSDNETIRLLDREGRTVDIYSY
ncbi:MAG TPA: hypothetical protein VJA87_00995 [Candidatus Paceibacterota bacterium]